MVEFAEPLSRLIEQFEKLPGIGRRTAERLAWHVLKTDRDAALDLARAIRDVKDRLVPCRECFNVSDGEFCSICRSSRRTREKICVVEHPRDLVALEAAGVYDGLYHVLLGRVSPHEGVGADKTTLAALKERIRKHPDRGRLEVIVATNPDAEGEATALVVERELAEEGVTITRIARGLPFGGAIEFANVEILRDALEGRRDMKRGTGGDDVS